MDWLRLPPSTPEKLTGKAFTSQVKRVGWGKTKGTEERHLETLKVQTAGRPRILETWRWGQEKREGAPEVRKKEIRQKDHFRF